MINDFGLLGYVKVKFWITKATPLLACLVQENGRVMDHIFDVSMDQFERVNPFNLIKLDRKTDFFPYYFTLINTINWSCDAYFKLSILEFYVAFLLL